MTEGCEASPPQRRRRAGVQFEEAGAAESYTGSAVTWKDCKAGDEEEEQSEEEDEQEENHVMLELNGINVSLDRKTLVPTFILDDEEEDDDTHATRKGHIAKGDSLLSMGKIATKNAPEEYHDAFIRTSVEDEECEEMLLPEQSALRRILKRLFRNQRYDFIMGCVVLFDFAAICRDTDARAQGDGQVDVVAVTIMNICFAAYVFEMVARFYVFGLVLLRRWAVILDVVVVSVSILEQAMELTRALVGGSSFVVVRTIRLLRLLRIVRVIKVFAGMKELRRLTQMIATCTKTMFWSFVMSFLVMSMWSVLAVELVHPVVQDLAENGQWADCSRCERAFESVMAANLTFFKTILAGDSWGLLAVPLSEAAPLTSLVLCGSLMTLSYGIMQLITAVVVDSFADQRKKDMDAMVTEIDEEEKTEKDALRRIFAKIDADSSGSLTFQELVDGAMRVREFQDWLRVMDLDSGDLARLFTMLDSDGDGSVSPAEFIYALYRLRNSESKTTTKLVKHVLDNVESTTQSVQTTVQDLQRRFDEMRTAQLQHTYAEGSHSRPLCEEVEPMIPRIEAVVHRATGAALEAGLSAASLKLQSLLVASGGSSTQDLEAAKKSLGLFTPSTATPRPSTATYGSIHTEEQSVMSCKAPLELPRTVAQASQQVAMMSSSPDPCHGHGPKNGDAEVDPLGEGEGGPNRGPAASGSPRVESRPWIEFLELSGKADALPKTLKEDAEL
eukprot:TRINITY_DN8011_c0_g2_i2.p1 TRINITY_DN8011_c0_g2~~TRINITY_DN8011_c0_g2_i2.p1  ORF type:complete len:729 (-),score=132.94 TRINITY_DN8011_c0_g2_i2:468-2654(-)